MPVTPGEIGGRRTQPPFPFQHPHHTPWKPYSSPLASDPAAARGLGLFLSRYGVSPCTLDWFPRRPQQCCTHWSCTSTDIYHLKVPETKGLKSRCLGATLSLEAPGRLGPMSFSWLQSLDSNPGILAGSCFPVLLYMALSPCLASHSCLIRSPDTWTRAHSAPAQSHLHSILQPSCSKVMF